MYKIIGVLAVVAVIAIGGFLLQKDRGEALPEEEKKSTDSTAMEAQSADGTGTLADLMGRGGEWKCTFTSQTALGSASGVVYIKDKNVRGDFSMEAPMVGSMTAYMLADEEYTYSWSSVVPQGVKARRTDGDTNATSDTPTSAQMVDEQMALDYSCEKAAVDNALFEVPGNITFAEVN